ncbi:MAG TPA: ATP synthase subunit I [Methylococcaceae bacterium]|nr:ATP synthase subunit I [Methylococcaceae bacterium]
MGKSPIYPGIRRILRLQAALLAVSGGVGYALGGADTALSVLAGGAAGFLPNIYFALKAGRRRDNRPARDVVNDFYVGEALKLILTALLFAVAVQTPGIQVLPMLGGFMAVAAAFWLILLLNDQTG